MTGFGKPIDKNQMLSLDLGLINAPKGGKTHLRAKSSPKASRLPNGLNPLFVPGLMGLKNNGPNDHVLPDYRKKFTMPSSKTRLHNHSSGVLSNVPSADLKVIDDVIANNGAMAGSEMSPLETSDHNSQRRLIKQTHLYTNTQFIDTKPASINVYSKKAAMP